MNDDFLVVDPTQLQGNFFKKIDKEWMLITAGTPDDFNTMTASWGTLGILWNKPIATCFVRPQRHTFSFMENNDFYTLCFFPHEFRDTLLFCGTHSGKDVDKVKETGLIVAETELGNVFFKQASIVIEAKKIYADDIKPQLFLDPAIEKNYPIQDYHRFYIGEIISCMIKK